MLFIINKHVTVLSPFQCDGITSRNQFFQSVPSSDPPVLALLGSGCSVATEPVAQIIHHWNISQVRAVYYSDYDGSKICTV